MKLNNIYNAAQIADIIKADIIGDSSMKILGLNEIHRVTEGDLTFVDHPKYYTKTLNSSATAVIINLRVECPENKVLFYSDDPFRDYVLLVNKFSPFTSTDKSISDSARIGKNTVIQPGAFVGNNVVIGDNCLIHSNVSIYNNCIIGNNVIINSNSVVGGDAFYFKRRPTHFDKLLSCGRVIIEDYVEIGSCTTIDRGVSSDTIIGQGTKMDNHIQIGHDTVIGKNCLFASQVAIAGVVTIEDDVILWGQVGVQKDLTIGKGAIVLAQSGVGKSLKANTTYFGSPAVEARKKMKEIALINSLPDILNKIGK